MIVAMTRKGTVSLHQYGPDDFTVEIYGYQTKRADRLTIRRFYSQYVPDWLKIAFDDRIDIR